MHREVVAGGMAAGGGSRGRFRTLVTWRQRQQRLAKKDDRREVGKRGQSVFHERVEGHGGGHDHYGHTASAHDQDLDAGLVLKEKMEGEAQD